MAKDKEKNREYQRAWYERNKHKTEIFRDKKRKRRMSRQTLIESYKAKGCNRCSENHPACLDFHHKDESTKLFNIGSQYLGKYDDLIRELDKCIVLCSNCHRKEHYNRRAIRPMVESNALEAL